MMNKKILFGLMFGILLGMVLIGGVSAINFLCYQESANVSVNCGGMDSGGLNTGSYVYPGAITPTLATSWIDGNWDTHTAPLTGSGSVNYTVPLGARNKQAIWQIKYIDQGIVYYANYTLLNCTNSSIANINQTVYNEAVKTWLRHMAYKCNNVSILDFYWNTGGNSTGGGTFEEAIIWNITTPNATVYTPSGLFGYVTPGLNVSLNYSIIPDSTYNFSSCWYYYNVSNVTLNCTINSTIGLYSQKNFSFYANDTFGGLFNKTFNWDYSIFENSKSFANLTTAGSTETFTINITYPTTIYSGITATLVYNNTNYVMTTSDAGGTQFYTASLAVPWTTSTLNKTFYYSFFLVNSTGNVTLNSSWYNQTVTTFLIDNCTTYGHRIASFRIYDEETLANLSGTIKITAHFYDKDRTYLFNTFNATLNYSGNESNINSSSICLANITGDFSMDYVAQFYNGSALSALGTTAGGYYIKYKMIQNYTLNNQTIEQNVSLYDLLYTSGYIFQVIVRGVSGGNAGVLVDAQKQYLPTADFKSIESYVTDSSGVGVVHLVPAAAVYNFLVSRNGHLLGTFNSYQVKCDNYATGDCTVRLNVYQATTSPTDYTKFGNIQGAFLIDQNIRTLYFTWSTTDGSAHTVEQNIVVFDGYANQTICNNTATGTSGTFTCVIPGLYGNTTFIARTYVYSDRSFVDFFVFALGEPIDFQGVDVIMELLMFSSLVLLFMQAPVFIVVGAIVGFTMAVILIFMGGATMWTLISVLAYFMAAGFLIIAHLRRGGNA